MGDFAECSNRDEVKRALLFAQGASVLSGVLGGRANMPGAPGPSVEQGAGKMVFSQDSVDGAYCAIDVSRTTPRALPATFTDPAMAFMNGLDKAQVELLRELWNKTDSTHRGKILGISPSPGSLDQAEHVERLNNLFSTLSPSGRAAFKKFADSLDKDQFSQLSRLLKSTNAALRDYTDSL